MQALPRTTDMVLNIRGLHAYAAQDDDDLVLVLQEQDPGGAGVVVMLETGFGGSLQDAIVAAEHLARAAWHWAELLRVRAGERRPIKPSFKE